MSRPEVSSVGFYRSGCGGWFCSEERQIVQMQKNICVESTEGARWVLAPVYADRKREGTQHRNNSLQLKWRAHTINKFLFANACLR